MWGYLWDQCFIPWLIVAMFKLVMLIRVLSRWFKKWLRKLDGQTR